MAYAQVKCLVEQLERCEDEVWLFAELHTLEVVPEMPYEYLGVRKDPDTGDYLYFEADVTTADDATLEAALPLEISDEASRDGSWPEGPEVDCYAHPSGTSGPSSTPSSCT